LASRIACHTRSGVGSLLAGLGDDERHGITDVADTLAKDCSQTVSGPRGLLFRPAYLHGI